MLLFFPNSKLFPTSKLLKAVLEFVIMINVGRLKCYLHCWSQSPSEINYLCSGKCLDKHLRVEVRVINKNTKPLADVDLQKEQSVLLWRERRLKHKDGDWKERKEESLEINRGLCFKIKSR